MESREIIVLSCLGMYFVLAYFISKIMPQGKRATSGDKTSGEAAITEKIYMGRYIGGLSNKITEAPFMFCTVTSSDFIFTQGTQGKEISRIPRHALSKVVVMSGAQVTQSFTDKNIRLIAGNKNKAEAKTSSLIIEWCDEKGVKHNAVFEFLDSKSHVQAKAAADSLHKWMTIKIHKAANLLY
jgi:hypothetical protein